MQGYWPLITTNVLLRLEFDADPLDAPGTLAVPRPQSERADESRCEAIGRRLASDPGVEFGLPAWVTARVRVEG